MRAFREAARALAGDELAADAREDLHALQDRGSIGWATNASVCASATSP
jgi:hypothetical protein